MKKLLQSQSEILHQGLHRYNDKAAETARSAIGNKPELSLA